MKEKIVRTYEDGVLVNTKKVFKKATVPKLGRPLELLDAVKTAHKEYLWQYELLADEVRYLRKKLVSLEHLLKIRTQERDGAKEAHKLRLQQIHELEEENIDLFHQIENLEDEDEDDGEEDEIVISMTDAANDNRPRAFAAKAIRKSK